MNIIIGLVIAYINYILLIKDEAKAINLFVILSVIFPRSIVGSIHLSYSYVFFPFLLWWYIKIKKQNILCDYYSLPLYCCLIWTCIVTFISPLFLSEVQPNYISLIGTLKFIIIILILGRCSCINNDYLYILRVIIFANCIAMIAEFFMMQSIGSVETSKIIETLWGATGNNNFRSERVESGFGMSRLFGTFNTSAFPATLSIMGIALFWNELRKNNSYIALLSLLASLLCGMGTASKRFFMGGCLFWLLAIILNCFMGEKKRTKRNTKIIYLVVSFIVVTPLIYSLLKDYLAIDYYLQFLLDRDIQGATESRFGEDTIMSAMISYVKKYWITGLGDVTIENVNVTDSMYYVTLFKSGVIGFAFILSLLFLLLKKAIRKVLPNALIVLAIIVFEFIIGTEFYSDLGALMLAYVVASVRDTRLLTLKSSNSIN